MENPNESTLVADEEQPQPEVTPIGAVPATPGAGDEGKTAPTEPTPETQPVEPKTPKERVYSKEEWSKRESTLTKQVAEAQRQAQVSIAEAERKATEAVARIQKQEDEAFIAKVETDGGDVDSARRVITAQQAIRERESQLNKREASFQVESMKAFEIAKRNDAERLAREYGLTDVDSLMIAENPTQMELIASKSALETAKAGAKPAVKTDTNIPTARGADWSKLNPTEKVLQGLGDVFK